MLEHNCAITCFWPRRSPMHESKSYKKSKTNKTYKTQKYKWKGAMKANARTQLCHYLFLPSLVPNAQLVVMELYTHSFSSYSLQAFLIWHETWFKYGLKLIQISRCNEIVPLLVSALVGPQCTAAGNGTIHTLILFLFSDEYVPLFSRTHYILYNAHYIYTVWVVHTTHTYSFHICQ